MIWLIYALSGLSIVGPFAMAVYLIFEIVKDIQEAARLNPKKLKHRQLAEHLNTPPQTAQ